MSKVLLLNPSLWLNIHFKFTGAQPRIPNLGLAAVASSLREQGHKIAILDLASYKKPLPILMEYLKTFSPDYVGISFTTPLATEAYELSFKIKKFSPHTKLIAGGVHPSVMPGDVLQRSAFEVAVLGEGDFTLSEVIQSDGNWQAVSGICFKQEDEIRFTAPREKIKNLDDLPFPAWELFDLRNKYYTTSKILARQNPAVGMETSRGCPYSCTFCGSKKLFGHRVRYKSVERVLQEMKYLLKFGVKEIHIYDDLFTNDLERAKEICRGILRNNLRFTWNLFTGVRVDSIDQEFLKLAKKAGCYQIGMGVDAGNQKVLDRLKKQTTISQAKEAFAMVEAEGIETVGLFMVGTPGETEQTLQDTIDLAVYLSPTYAVLSLFVPLPGSADFAKLQEEGRIRSYEWHKYLFHSSQLSDVYNHQNLSWPTIFKYYNKFYSKVYTSPKYIYKRIKRGLRMGPKYILADISYFIKSIAKKSDYMAVNPNNK